MIQRIQTIFLLLVVVFTVLVMCLPLFELFSQTSGIYDSRVWGVYQGGKNLYCTWPLMVICILNVFIAFLSIMLYKNRILQIRFCTFNLLLFIGFYCMLAFYVFAEKEIFCSEVNFKLPFILPFCNIILSYLAIRNIKKDEETIRSLNRIR